MAPGGNAVTAKWVGPSGYQLYDGTPLNPGDVVADIGKDEAQDNPFWEVVKGKAPEDATSVERIRLDQDFGVEEGGGATGRPVVKGQDPAPATTADPPKGADS